MILHEGDVSFDINKRAKHYYNKSISYVLGRLEAQGNKDAVVAVFAAKPDSVDAQEFQLSGYSTECRDFLKKAKDKGIPIIHFRDPFKFRTPAEPSLEKKFGISADYEIATIPEIAIPLELGIQYFQQMELLSFYIPNISNEYKLSTIHVVGVDHVDLLAIQSANHPEPLEQGMGVSQALQVLVECVKEKEGQVRVIRDAILVDQRVIPHEDEWMRLSDLVKMV